MQLGIDVSSRYSSFEAPAKVWASSSERTTASADSFIKGLVRQSNETRLVSVYESEEAGADSLTPHESCPNFSGSRGSKQSSTYMKQYTKPIIARFNAQAAKFNFTMYDIYGMQQLCGYETVIRGESPFCDLFTPEEWLSFEYANDIMYHYELGYGSDLVPYLGIPFVNATTELLASDSSDQQLYVSFTHREEPPFVLAALNLFNSSTFTGTNDPNASFPLTQINHQRAWKSSNFIPFLGNIAVERLECNAMGYDGETYVRVLVNSSPQPLPGCASGPAESCPMKEFVDTIQQRSEKYADFSGACGVDYKNSTDTLGIFTKS
jgi:acid phosphatase